MADGWRVLVHGGVVVPTDPGPAAAFLRASKPGAYTTTRTSDGGSTLLLWERHMARLYESLQLLHTAHPNMYPHLRDAAEVKRLVEPSVEESLARTLKLRRPEEEVNLSILVCSSNTKQSQLEGSDSEVFVLASNYRAAGKDEILPAIKVAVMGPGRKIPRAKDSLWTSTRQGLESVKPSGTNEIILSANGNDLLEGLVTNFFVVKLRDAKNHGQAVRQFESGHNELSLSDYEVLTAPLSDGVLNGVVRNVIIEVCREAGIAIREVSPCWSSHHTWKEAFVTNALRILQPVTSIQIPASWPAELDPGNFKETEWQTCNLETCGMVTRRVHDLVMDRICQLSTPVINFTHK
ncbi:hypothetical protein R1sor_005435 [Riccia sorocarpa]|uniref:Class IV aminotransferase n=1 Tax=Riccia sorocarpa TaxID=122646 RepID=A0ABD3HN76_9MARC